MHFQDGISIRTSAFPIRKTGAKSEKIHSRIGFSIGYLLAKRNPSSKEMQVLRSFKNSNWIPRGFVTRGPDCRSQGMHYNIYKKSVSLKIFLLRPLFLHTNISIFSFRNKTSRKNHACKNSYLSNYKFECIFYSL